MIESEMTAEQIKKALLCCTEVDKCVECPYSRLDDGSGISACFQCSQDALNLIESQEQRINELKTKLFKANRLNEDINKNARNDMAKKIFADMFNVASESIDNTITMNTDDIVRMAKRYCVNIKADC